MKFQLDHQSISWDPGRLVIAGYTAKDQDAAYKHIEELKKLGVPAPPHVPMLYDLSPSLLTTDNLLVVGDRTSGEAEAVLLKVGGQWFLGLGSDHTDRDLEATSVQKSKQICSKPVSRHIWNLEAVNEHWDEIELRSWVTLNGKERRYQTGTLGAFLNPSELLGIVRERGYEGEDLVLFCGTLPLLSGEFVFGEAFRAELVDAHSHRTITLSYRISRLKDAEID